MKVNIVLTKNPFSLRLLEDMVRSHARIDNVIVYSKNLPAEASYPASMIIDALKAEGINIIEQKPNYPYEHFRGAIILSNR